VDLFEGKNPKAVLTQIHSLGRQAQLLPGYSGPTLGATLATKTERTFTEQQLVEARNATTFLRSGQKKSDIISEAEENHRKGVTPAVFAALKARKEAAAAKLAEMRAARVKALQAAAEAQAMLEALLEAERQRLEEEKARIEAEALAEKERIQAAEQAERDAEFARIEAAAQAERERVEAEAKVTRERYEAELARLRAEQQAGFEAALLREQEENRSGLAVGEMEIEARAWIEALTGAPLEGPLIEALKDGVALCNLANAIQPGVCVKPSPSKMPFKQMENIGAYLKASEKLKVPPHDTFQTVDLFEGKNPKAVLTQIHSLGRQAQLLPGYSGPTLGATLATKTERNFTEQQLNEAKAAITGLRTGGTEAVNPVVQAIKAAELARAAAQDAEAAERAAALELAELQAQQDAVVVVEDAD